MEEAFHSWHTLISRELTRQASCLRLIYDRTHVIFTLMHSFSFPPSSSRAIWTIKTCLNHHGGCTKWNKTNGIRQMCKSTSYAMQFLPNKTQFFGKEKLTGVTNELHATKLHWLSMKKSNLYPKDLHYHQTQSWK